MSDLVEICALWEKTSQKTGNQFLSGEVSRDFNVNLKPGDRILVFENNSDNDKAPAFKVYFAPSRPADPQPESSGYGQSQNPRRQKEFFNTKPEDVRYGEPPPEDLPF